MVACVYSLLYNISPGYDMIYVLVAPRFWYKGNSFTEYVLPGEERRRRRAVADEPGSFFNRFSNYITMQIRLDPGVKTALFFYMISQDGREYSRLGVRSLLVFLLLLNYMF